MTANKPLEDAVIIGIDFGTTYSGVAWAYSREPEEIEIVTSWESELNHCSDVEKAPTQIHYGHNSRDIKWGYGISPEHEPLKWFKLLLLEPKDIPQGAANSTQLKEARRLQSKVGKEPVEIVACFLRKIWDHSVESIRRAIGDGVMKRSKFQNFCGLIYEQAGDTIVVCDAGGGTVSRLDAPYDTRSHLYIILVGGFGRSRFLFNNLQERFRRIVLQSRGNKPWTAICRGAVVQGLVRHNPSTNLGVDVETRVARMSYGIMYGSPFIEGYHNEADKTWSHGEDISEKRSVSHSYVRYFEVPSFQGHEKIYCSTSRAPPVRYGDSDDIHHLCAMKWDKIVDVDTLLKWTNPVGVAYPRLDYHIKMDCEDGTVNFSLHYQGSKVGEEEVEVQFN
uniref:Heat shock 70 kDa protein 12B n=1 Tax=Fusarium oxysporum (strain Fo5176) TaxID=660025 RepID=A0A0D2XA94_FUSOF